MWNKCLSGKNTAIHLKKKYVHACRLACIFFLMKDFLFCGRQATSQQTNRKRFSPGVVHIEFKNLLVLPHLYWNIVEPLPYYDRVCLPACLQASGRESGPLRCLFALESSANHNVPFLPLCCHTAASTPLTVPPLSLSLSLVPQPYLPWVKQHSES